MTAATTHKPRNRFPRGSAHPGALYTTGQMARAKRMLLEADREVRYAPGEFDRIASECGISRVAVRTLAHGEAWSWLEPALPGKAVKKAAPTLKRSSRGGRR